MLKVLFSMVVNKIPQMVVLTICAILLGLNVRNHNITSTNNRLEALLDVKEQRIMELRMKNKAMDDEFRALIMQLQSSNDILMKMYADRENHDKRINHMLGKINKSLESDPTAALPVPPAALEQLRNAGKRTDRQLSESEANPAATGQSDR